MSKSENFPLLYFPGLLALVVGAAMAFNWETLLLLLFLVGAVYPAIVVAALITLTSLLGVRRRPLDIRRLFAAAISAIWIGMLLVSFAVSQEPKTTVFASVSLVAGLLICGCVAFGHIGSNATVAILSSLILPTGLYIHLSSVNSAQQSELRLVMLEKRLQDVMGTLDWETEGPSLMAEKRAVEAEIRDINTRRWRAMERVPAAVGLLALVVATMIRRRSHLLALALAISGVFCIFLSIGFLSTVP